MQATVTVAKKIDKMLDTYNVLLVSLTCAGNVLDQTTQFRCHQAIGWVDGTEVSSVQLPG